MNSDYRHEDTLKHAQWLKELRLKRNQAEQEAQNARSLRGDLEGPIMAAEAAVERFSAQISDVERLVERVKEGYHYFERLGFENAVDAIGEVCTWTVLSEIPVPGTIFGHADAHVRLPVSVQKLYAQAKSTQLFERFKGSRCACVSNLRMMSTTHRLKMLSRTIFLVRYNRLKFRIKEVPCFLLPSGKLRVRERGQA